MRADNPAASIGIDPHISVGQFAKALLGAGFALVSHSGRLYIEQSAPAPARKSRPKKRPPAVRPRTRRATSRRRATAHIG